MNIEQRIKALKKEQEELTLLKKKQDSENLLLKLKDKLEGRVTVTYEKSLLANNVILNLKYYKNIFLKGDLEHSISYEGEVINISVHNGRTSYKHEVISKSSFQNTFTKNQIQDIFYTAFSYTSVEEFDRVKNASSHFLKSLVSSHSTPHKEYINGFSKQELSILDSQKHLLDIPHITLTEKDAWKLGKNIFLIKNIFLLTPNSMAWLEEWYRKESEKNRFTHEFLSSADRDYLHRSQEEATHVYNLIKNHYDKSNSKRS